MTSTYTYYEFKLVVAGDIIVTDSTGQKVKAVKGDMIYFPKDSTSTSLDACPPSSIVQSLMRNTSHFRNRKWW